MFGWIQSGRSNTAFSNVGSSDFIIRTDNQTERIVMGCGKDPTRNATMYLSDSAVGMHGVPASNTVFDVAGVFTVGTDSNVTVAHTLTVATLSYQTATASNMTLTDFTSTTIVGSNASLSNISVATATVSNAQITSASISNATVGSNLDVGSTITVGSGIYPASNNGATLGNSSNRFMDLWLGGQSFHIGDTTLLQASNGDLEIMDNTETYLKNMIMAGATIGTNSNPLYLTQAPDGTFAMYNLVNSTQVPVNVVQNVWSISNLIGVGVSNPSHALDVQGSANVSGSVLINNLSALSASNTTLVLNPSSSFSGGVQTATMTISNLTVQGSLTVPGTLTSVNVYETNVNTSNIITNDLTASNMTATTAITEAGALLSDKYALSNALEAYSNAVDSQYAAKSDLSTYSNWVDSAYEAASSFQAYSNFVDSKYAASNTLSNYLPISGGTVGGDLVAGTVSATSATFSNVTIQNSSNVSLTLSSTTSGDPTSLKMQNTDYTWEWDGPVAADSSLQLNLSSDTHSTLATPYISVHPDGTVGIGMSNPQYALDVNGTINATQVLVNGSPISSGGGGGGSAFGWQSLSSNVYTNCNVGISTSSPHYPLDVAGAVNATSFLKNGTSIATYWSMQGTNMYTTSNVGIGTQNPSYALDVVGTINAQSVLVNGSPVSAGYWRTSSALMYTMSNVGIGTSTPSRPLDVVGNAGITGSLTTTGSITTSGSLTVSGNTTLSGNLTASGVVNIASAAWGDGVTFNSGNNRIYSDASSTSLIVNVDSTSNFAIATGGTTRLVMNGSSGKFAIGKSNADYDLDVAGTISATTYCNVSWSMIANKPALCNVATTSSYTDLANKPALCNVATTASYADLLNKPNLATVATSGSYIDLTNRPSLAAVAVTGSYADLASKPALCNLAFSSDWSDINNVPSGLSGITTNDLSNFSAASVVFQHQVGVGTNSPAYTLDVAGTINATSYCNVPWSGIVSKPTFATVATSGRFADLTTKPTALSQFANDLTTFTCNVGIKTSSPQYDLHVQGVVYATTYCNIDWSMIGNVPSSEYPLWTNVVNAPTALSQFTNNLTTFPNTVNFQSNIGVGVVSPTVALDVFGAVKATTYCNMTWSMIQSKPSFATVATSGLYTDVTGAPTKLSQLANDLSNFSCNVGIKTTNPLYSLHVAGTMYATTYCNVDYASLLNKPSFATVATSGLYSDLSGAPTKLSGFANDLAAFSCNVNFAGKVGIYNASPAYELDVSGAINATSYCNIQWSQINSKPAFCNVATSGSYTDLANKPALCNVATTGSYTDLANKPSLCNVATTGSYTSLADKPSLCNVALSAQYTDLQGVPQNLSQFTNDLSNFQHNIGINKTNPAYALDVLGAVSATTYCNLTYAMVAGAPTLCNVATTGLYSDLEGAPTNLSAFTNDLSNFAANTVAFHKDVSVAGAVSATSYCNIDWSMVHNPPTIFSGLYADLVSAPSLCNVATSGAFSDLTGKPSLCNVATTGSYTDLTNKPSLCNVATTGAWSDLSGTTPALSVFTNDLSNFSTLSSSSLEVSGDITSTAGTLYASTIDSSSASSNLSIGCSSNTYVINLGVTSAEQIINIGTGGSSNKTINIGDAGDVINIPGVQNTVNLTNSTTSNKNIFLNINGADGSAGGAGVLIEENSNVVSYMKLSSDRNSFLLRTPTGTSDVTMDMSGDKLTLNSTMSIVSSHVGIGTSSPNDRLTVGDGQIRVHKSASVSGDAAAIYFSHSNIAQDAKIASYNNTTNNQVDLAFYTSSNQSETQVMTLANQYVGIGTSSPSAALDVESPDAVQLKLVSTSSNGGGLRIKGSPGSGFTIRQTSTGDVDFSQADSGVVGFHNKGDLVLYDAANSNTERFRASVSGSLYENGTSLATKYAPSNALSNYQIGSVFVAYSNWADGQYAPSNTLSNYVLSSVAVQAYAPSNVLSNLVQTSTANSSYAPSNALSNYVLSSAATSQFAPSNTLSNYLPAAQFTTFSNWVSPDRSWTSGPVVYTYSNVAINSNSAAGYNFYVNGSACVNGGLTTTNSPIYATRSAATANTAAMKLINTNSNGTSMLGFGNGSNDADDKARIGWRSNAAGTGVLTFWSGTSNALAEQMCIDESGHLGVGKQSPAYKLDVNGAVNASSFLLNGSALQVGYWQTAGANQYTGSNVGVGTSNATAALTVGTDFAIAASSTAWNTAATKGLFMKYSTVSGQDAAYFQSIDRTTSTLYNMEVNGSNIAFGATGALTSPTLYVQYGGKVGINKNSPQYALDVSGAISATSYCNVDYTTLLNKPTFATVATSGSYADLTNKPALCNIATTGNWNDLNNKPSLCNVATTGAYADLTGKPTNLSSFTNDLTQFSTQVSFSSNVGINTASPSYNLDVNGTVNASNFLVNGVPIANTIQAGYWATNSTIQYTFSNVGIASTNPQAALQVGNDIAVTACNGAWNNIAGKGLFMRYSTWCNQDAAYIQSVNRNTNVMYNMSIEASNIGIGAGGIASPSVFVRYDGKVGIGNSNPAQKLDVAGAITAVSYCNISWSMINSIPTFATVATTGSYNDLTNKPSYCNIASTASWSDLYNKPSFCNIATSASYADLTGTPTLLSSFTNDLSVFTQMVTFQSNVQFQSVNDQRKITLYEVANNSNQFTGFGVNSGIFRYQAATTLVDHVFYAGTSASNSSELLRVKGTGNVGVGTSNPSAKLHVYNGNFQLDASDTPTVTMQSQQSNIANGGEIVMLKSSGVDGFKIRNVLASNALNIMQYASSTEISKMWISSNIGIKTTTPAYDLDVNGTVNATTYCNIQWSQVNSKPSFCNIATTGAWSDLSGKPTTLSYFTNDLSNFTGVVTFGSNVGIGGIVGTPQATLDVNGNIKCTSIAFSSSNLTLANIYSGGTLSAGCDNATTTINIGCATVSTNTINIATSSPASTINVGSSADTITLSGSSLTLGAPTLTTQAGLITMNSSGGSNSAGSCGFQMYENSNATAYIKTSADRGKFLMKTPAGSEMSMDLTNNAVNINSGAFYIGSDGKIGMGTTSPSQQLEVAGIVKCTSVLTTSDATLKTNISRVPNALEKIGAIEGVYFDWADQSTRYSVDTNVGVLAQQVECILPEAVRTMDDKSKAVDYHALIALCINAINEQQAEIKELRSRLV